MTLEIRYDTAGVLSEDADCLPSVQQLRTDREYWIRLFYAHSKVNWDGESELSLHDQVRLLKAAIEPGCPNYPDLGYYLRHAAYKFAENQRYFRKQHQEYQTLVDIIHRQREELARLNKQVAGLLRDVSTDPTNPTAGKE